MNCAIVLALAVLLAAAACGGEETQPTPTPLPTASATPTPAVPATAAPTPTSAPAQQLAPGTRVIFVRGSDESYLPGEIWISDPDGSNQTRLTPEGVWATFAGVTSLKGEAAPVLYYVSWDNEIDRTLWALDLGTGERAAPFGFEGWSPGRGSAAVSPDGTQIAYASNDGLSILDLATGETRLLVEAGSWHECVDGRNIGACRDYEMPAWSPDGRLLASQALLYEIGALVVVDPSGDPPVEVRAGRFGFGGWSPSSDAVCTFGNYADRSALYISSQPDWQQQGLLAEYEESVLPQYLDRTVNGCAWLDPGRVLVSIGPMSYDDRRTEIVIADVRDRSVTPLIDLDGTNEHWLLKVPGTPKVISQFGQRPPKGYRPVTPTQPLVIDVETGSAQPILSPGGWVVALLSP